MDIVKKLIFSLSCICLASTSAFPADLPSMSPVPAPPPLLQSALPYFVHFGPAGIMLSESAKVSLAGALVLGASVKVDPQLTLVVEAGMFVTRNIAISLTAGVPPRVDIMGKGTIAPLGRLGGMTYGPSTLTAHYHFMDLGRFQPYIGLGPTFLLVMGTTDGALSNLKVNNSVGIAAQIGADYMFTEKLGMFVDVKKAYLRTTSTGNLGPFPTKSSVKLDPLVVHTGMTFRF